MTDLTFRTQAVGLVSVNPQMCRHMDVVVNDHISVGISHKKVKPLNTKAFSYQIKINIHYEIKCKL